MSSVSSLAAIWERKIQQSSNEARVQPKYVLKGNIPITKTSSDKPLERPEKILFRIKQKQQASHQLPQTLIIKAISAKTAERQQEKIQNRQLCESSQDKKEQIKEKSTIGQDIQGIGSLGGQQETEARASICDPKQQAKVEQITETPAYNMIVDGKIQNQKLSLTPSQVILDKKEKDPDQNIKSVKQLRKQWESINLNPKETPKGTNQKVQRLFTKQKLNIPHHQSQNNAQVSQSKKKAITIQPQQQLQEKLQKQPQEQLQEQSQEQPQEKTQEQLQEQPQEQLQEQSQKKLHDQPQEKQNSPNLQHPEATQTSDIDWKRNKEYLQQSAHEQRSGHAENREKEEIEDQRMQNQPTLLDTAHVSHSESQQGQLTQKQTHQDTKPKEKNQEPNINAEFVENEPKNRQIQQSSIQKPILETPLYQIIQDQNKPQVISDHPLIETTLVGDEAEKDLKEQGKNFKGLQGQHQQLQKDNESPVYQQVQEQLRKIVFNPSTGKAHKPNLPEVQMNLTETQVISQEMFQKSTGRPQSQNRVVQGPESKLNQILQESQRSKQSNSVRKKPKQNRKLPSFDDL